MLDYSKWRRVDSLQRPAYRRTTDGSNPPNKGTPRTACWAPTGWVNISLRRTTVQLASIDGEATVLKRQISDRPSASKRLRPRRRLARSLEAQFQAFGF